MIDSNGHGALILLYHRVTALATDPQLLTVNPEYFAAHLQLLSQIARPMALRGIVKAAAKGEDLRGAVAITFDDGYEDNLLHAKPILQQHGIPATVFVATAGTGANREFFWDELDRILLQSGTLPRRLSVSIGTVPYCTDLARSAEYSSDQAAEFRNWNITSPEDPTPRHRIYRDLCDLFHNATSEHRRCALKQIQEWSGEGADARPTHRMMTAAQLRELIQDGLIEVGSHTVTHPLLAIEKVTDQRREITVGKAAIESSIRQPVRGFSYPFGGRRDYTPDTVSAVKSAGFEYACSNFKGLVMPGTDPLQLPRVVVRDWTAAEFRDRLGGWLA